MGKTSRLGRGIVSEEEKNGIRKEKDYRSRKKYLARRKKDSRRH